ncbi:MAG: tRNA 2-thiouridine(34) synthase MnmA [Candidatus Cloacimonadaceae bacterium]|nr:tRNA 2-thiouridine(34) synthase MnmA [Candidatus Cloacimonadaceae bacterium]
MKKVALGMSGGIDSTMSALLLLEQGYEVIGITMAIWDDSIDIKESIKSGCYGPGEIHDLEAAKKACAELGIEHYIIELKEEFSQNVLSYFCDTYLDGKTPNPCVMCNQRMKFGFLPERAKAMGLDFDYFATGHYVRKSYEKALQRWQLHRAADSGKDQSYFLCFLSQKQLSHVIFPLGELTKAEIRELAKRKGFTYLTEKKESQDFLETDDYSVLFEQNAFSEGDIVDLQNNVIGTHKGLIHYTIGQRRNLGISGRSEPWYVLSIDAQANRVVMGPKQYLYRKELSASNVNWLSIAPPETEIKASAKIRLQHDPAPCTVIPLGKNKVRVIFNLEQLSITPGQVVAIYHENTLLGGGIID